MTYSGPSVEEIIAANPLVEVMRDNGAQFTATGGYLYTLCPFHDDHTPSFRVTESNGTWYCPICKAGGAVIEFWMRFNKCDKGTAIRALKERAGMSDADVKPKPKPLPVASAPARQKSAAEPAKPEPQGKIVKTYDYTNPLGQLVFQAVRIEPGPKGKKKTFLRRCPDGKGGWIWNLKDVELCLYRLPGILAADKVWIVEGEKDADSLTALGFVATCNIGGSSDWKAGYAETLRGKSAILCGDNDDAGRGLMKDILESLTGKVTDLRLVTVPAEFNDITDYIEEFSTEDAARHAVTALRDAGMLLAKGLTMPIYVLPELRDQCRQALAKSELTGLDLGKWLPSLRRYIQPLVPGELMTIISDTGVGKSAILQNIALCAAPLAVLVFEIELPADMMYVRNLAISHRLPAAQIESLIRRGDLPEDANWRHVAVCPLSRVTVADIERLIGQAELKMGTRPAVVMIDYLQLIRGGAGSRYEKMSQIAEELKVIAKSTGTVMIVASQIRRKTEAESTEVHLHDPKESGSIENSSGLVLGAWRPDDDEKTLLLRVLKCTKGAAGALIRCNFGGPTLRITEQARQPDDNDISSEAIEARRQQQQKEF